MGRMAHSNPVGCAIFAARTSHGVTAALQADLGEFDSLPSYQFFAEQRLAPWPHKPRAVGFDSPLRYHFMPLAGFGCL